MGSGGTVLHVFVEQDLNERNLNHSSFSRAVLSQGERNSGETHVLIMFLVLYLFVWLHAGTSLLKILFPWKKRTRS